MILIGDAAHPYGPGGQGISMALKDAKALCDVIAARLYRRGEKGIPAKPRWEARTLGEAAEKRNAKDLVIHQVGRSRRGSRHEGGGDLYAGNTEVLTLCGRIHTAEVVRVHVVHDGHPRVLMLN